MCMRFGNSQLPWREGLRRNAALPVASSANLQNQPTERVSGVSAAQLPESRGFAAPGCALQCATIRRRGEDRDSLWRLSGATSGHRLCGIVAGATLLPTARDGLRPGAEWNSAPRKSMRIDRPDPTGIFISIALAWFLQDADSDAGAEAAARPPLRADGGTAGAGPGFTAKPIPTAGRKPRLKATIITEGKPVPASGEQFCLTCC
jgi:hypothetical protein